MNVKRSLSWGFPLLLAGAWAYTKRAASYARLDAELRSPLLRFRSPAFTSTLIKATRHLPIQPASAPTDVLFDTHQIPGPAGAPEVAVYVYRPHTLPRPAAALLFIHGGGFVVGTADQFHDNCVRFARELGVVVVNVDYRLAPETPFPGPLEDCYAALRWMKEQADALGIDTERIAIVGESAGGGLAAALAQLAHDRGAVQPAFQLLLYPMLDDRTVLDADHAGRGEFVWTPPSNRLGWSSYLGHAPTPEATPEYAAPARRRNLAGLAPAWIGVGTLDLFFPEGKEYARRLNEAGVPCAFVEVPGAYHAFQRMQPNATVSKAFEAQSLDALRQALHLA